MDIQTEQDMLVEQNLSHPGIIESLDKNSELMQRRTQAFEIFQQIISGNSEIPPEEVDLTRDRINKAFEDALAPEGSLVGRATSAFLIHTRRTGEGLESLDQETALELDDAGRHFPALSRKYGYDQNTEEMIDELWNILPSFEVGKVKGMTEDGGKIDISLISTQITPTRLARFKSHREKLQYGREKTNEATDLARRLGAKVVGLGEVLGSLTHYGETLQQQFPDIKIATGHTFTTYFISEWVKEGAKRMEKDLSELNILIIGANGSIGTATTEILAEQNSKQLILHDIQSRAQDLARKALELENSNEKVEVSIFTGDEGLKEACQKADIIVSAASAPEPFIHSDYLKKGTWIVDDSQPPSITREEADKADCFLIWPLGKNPNGIVSTFNLGLIGNANYGCALEVAALEELYGETDLKTVGPVKSSEVRKAAEIAKTLGFQLPIPQSFGKEVLITA